MDEHTLLHGDCLAEMAEAKLALSRGLVRLAYAAIAELEAELAAIQARRCDGCGRYDYCFLWSESCRPFMSLDFACNRWAKRSTP